MEAVSGPTRGGERQLQLQRCCKHAGGGAALDDESSSCGVSHLLRTADRPSRAIGDIHACSRWSDAAAATIARWPRAGALGCECTPASPSTTLGPSFGYAFRPPAGHRARFTLAPSPHPTNVAPPALERCCIARSHAPLLSSSSPPPQGPEPVADAHRTPTRMIPSPTPSQWAIRAGSR